MTATETKWDRIAAHGRQLLAIFPDAKERDPVTLCKKLRRIEAEGARFALRLCNGPEFPTEEAQDAEHDRILIKAKNLLFGIGPENVPVFLNQDPRGYALKINDEWMRKHNVALHRDWGGYGIIAPEIS